MARAIAIRRDVVKSSTLVAGGTGWIGHRGLSEKGSVAEGRLEQKCEKRDERRESAGLKSQAMDGTGRSSSRKHDEHRFRDEKGTNAKGGQPH